MTNLLMQLGPTLRALHDEDGFLIGRVAVVVLILVVIVVAALVAWIVPNS